MSEISCRVMPFRHKYERAGWRLGRVELYSAADDEKRTARSSAQLHACMGMMGW